MRITALLPALLIEAILGCARAPSNRLVPCARPTAKSFVDLPNLAGTYEIEFIATDGEHRGKRVHGKLELWARDSVGSIPHRLDGRSNSKVREPYFGYMTADLASLGGFTEGLVTSRDVNAPGVTVWSWTDRAEGQVELRLGSNRNRRDRFILDGAYVGADLLEATPMRFAGRWDATIGHSVPHASGYFCAHRI